MPPTPLPPDQQALLDQFETDAEQAAADATAAADADANLLTVQATALKDKQAALDSHVKALASAAKFVQALVPGALVNFGAQAT